MNRRNATLTLTTLEGRDTPSSNLQLTAPTWDGAADYVGTANGGVWKTTDGGASAHSSGGAAGGIVSEGQGYGLFAAGR
jgi:hypothetical protein